MRKPIRLPNYDYNLDHPFYLTACTQDRKPWFKDYPALAAECESRLTEAAYARASFLFAWCVMPDRVHILIRDKDPIGYMRGVKGPLSKAARAIISGAGFWQRSFFDRALRSEESVLEVAHYIWANPVRAGLIRNPEAYPWSGSLVWPQWREEYGEEQDGRG